MFEATMAAHPAAGTGSRPGAGTTVLAIDFGTTYTTGALARTGRSPCSSSMTAPAPRPRCSCLPTLGWWPASRR
jgi:hypothetical protein